MSHYFQSSPHTTVVKFSSLFGAMEIVSTNSYPTCRARINSETGMIYVLLPECNEEEILPDDFESADKYIDVPDKRDLNLGKRLNLSFAWEYLPDEYDTVVAIFRRKGAYSRFRHFLENRGLIERWYAYQDDKTRYALRVWCENNGLLLEEDDKPLHGESPSVPPVCRG